MSNEEFLQWFLVGGPILSLLATWMSLRTYGRLRQKSIDKAKIDANNRELAAQTAPIPFKSDSGDPA